MSEQIVKIAMKFPLWKEELQRSRGEILLAVAASMQTNRALLFDHEGAYNGHPRWAPLKWRTGQILSLRGNLRRSMGPLNTKGTPGPDGIVRFSGDRVTIGTKLAYARLMNDGTKNMPGGVMRPTKAKALMIPVPSGVEVGRLRREIKKTDKQSSAEVGQSRRKKKDRLAFWLELREGAHNFKDLEEKIAALERAHRVTDGRQRLEIAEKLHRYKARRDKIDEKQKFIFRKWVRIPARPFDNWTPQDKQEMQIALKNKIAQVLRRAKKGSPK